MPCPNSPKARLFVVIGNLSSTSGITISQHGHLSPSLLNIFDGSSTILALPWLAADSQSGGTYVKYIIVFYMSSSSELSSTPVSFKTYFSGSTLSVYISTPFYSGSNSSTVSLLN